MKRYAAFTICLLCLFLCKPCFSGDGSLCDPSTNNWPMCSLDAVPFSSSVTNNATIPGGVYETPFVVSQPNTFYTLSGGIVAAGTAIEVKASNVIIDLNGNEILYNESVPGSGVRIGDYNKQNIAVRNGRITQGAAKSEGGDYGEGNNPISSYNGTTVGSSGLFIANMELTYGGRDVGGIFLKYCDGTVSNVTLKDEYGYGTLKNRHAGVSAVYLDYASVVKNVTTVGSRQRGVQVGSGSKVYDNKIGINSIAVNSFGVFIYEKENVEIYNNSINATGSHPIGIGFMSRSKNATVYGNDIVCQTTMIDDEYSGAYLANPNATVVGNFAVGIRSTWGADQGVFFNNTITVYSDSNYVGKYAPTGDTAYINGGARGLMIGTSPGKMLDFYENTISATDKDGTGNAYAASLTAHDSDWLFLRNNTVRSNVCNVAIGDEYGESAGYPLIYGNVIEKIDNYAAYATFENRFGGYSKSTARIVDNTYSGGANATAYRVNNNQYGIQSWYFGTKVAEEYVYNTHINDGDNTLTASVTETLDPAITLPYANPGDVPIDPSTICSASNPSPCLEAECSTLGLYWYDGQCNAVPEFLCALDNLSACTESQCSVLGKRWVDGVCTSQAAETDCPECPECPPSGGRLLMIGRKLLSLP